jgi:molybdenum cofactor guanylyltransferase
MTSTVHHKHPPIPKPGIGEWGRHEVSMLGAPCPVIRELAVQISGAVQHNARVCYVDAEHTDEHEDQAILPFAAEYTDRVQTRTLEISHSPSMFETRALLAQYDCILVNGNHFTAKEQIVLLHSKKLESLQRKTDRLTHVIAVVEYDISLDSCAFLHAYVQTHTRVFNIRDLSAILTWFAGRIPVPVVHGLVLAGGHSTRMGTDKSLIAYHGIPQRNHLLQLMQNSGIRAFLSCRADQMVEMDVDAELVVDKFIGMGPYGGLLSAMMSAPDAAWLVIASDLPLVTAETLEQLIAHRNPSKVATAFQNPETGFPEPLISLWEPKAYPLLLSYLAQGNICPRKALIQSDIQTVEPKHPEWLRNVNTPEDIDALRVFTG